MADFTKHQTSDKYSELLDHINDQIRELAKQLSGSNSNLFDDAVRWNPSNKRWEIRNSGNFKKLCDKYEIDIGGDADNALKLDGKEAKTSANANSIAQRHAGGRLSVGKATANGDAVRYKEAKDLSVVSDASTARSNLGLDTAATHKASDFADKNGSSSQRFSVKDPSSSHHAISKQWFEGQVDSKIENWINGYLDSSYDVNNIIETGVYRLNHTQNAPDVNGELLVLRGGDQVITQIYGNNPTNELYYRTGNPVIVGGRDPWPSWQVIASSYNLKTGTGNSKDYPMSQKAATDSFLTSHQSLSGYAKESWVKHRQVYTYGSKASKAVPDGSHYLPNNYVMTGVRRSSGDISGIYGYKIRVR